MIGTIVSHYEILEKLGEGGMGVVWKAQDTRLARFVALKFVPESVTQDSASVERLLREARAASALNHPHICTIYDIDEWEGRRFIVMELLEGVTLREKASGHALEIDVIVAIGLQLADALEVAHAKNIIHRDIKSTNIIVSPRGQAKILDFGLAKIVQPTGPRAANAGATIGVQEDLTQAGHAVGTAQSMSPEQALGKDVDGRTDLFSLGVVLYEMATGHAAFSGSTSAAVFDAILNKAPVAPVTLNPAVPTELSRIINKALEKDRELRYQGAAELATDLKRMRRDSDSRSTIAAAAPPTRRGRGRTGLLVGSGVTVALVAAAVGWFTLSRREPAPLPTGTTTPLTGLVGVESSGTWSPDGGFFAYEHTASGPAEIFIAAAGGGDPVRLVEGPADNASPRWSPDNRWIAFTSGRDGILGIYLVPTLGGAVQKLVDLDAHPLYADAGLGSRPWSADGRSLVFSREDSSGQSALWTKDIETRVESRLTQPPAQQNDRGGTRSPDGAWIAFSRADGVKAMLMLIASDGTKERTVLDDGNRNWNPAWTPDGRGLVYESDRNGGSDLWMINIDSPRPRAVTSGSQGAFSPTISRSGRLLYNTFTHQTDLYLRDLATGEEKRLTSHTKDNFGGRFSPDGSRIAYFSSRTGNGEIWIFDLATGSERRLTDHPKDDHTPEWSPDGRQIAFLSDRDGPTQVWIMGADGGAPRRLSERRASRPLRWSPDGTRIGFLSFEGKGGVLISIDPAGGDEKEQLGGIVDFDWYRDSRHAIVTMSQGKAGGELRAVDLENGARVTLLADPQGEVQVARDGSALTYCSALSHYNMNLHLLRLTAPGADGLPRAAAAPVALTHGDGEWHVHNGGWSADGKRLVYTRDTDSGDLFVTDGVFKAAGK